MMMEDEAATSFPSSSGFITTVDIGIQYSPPPAYQGSQRGSLTISVSACDSQSTDGIPDFVETKRTKKAKRREYRSLAINACPEVCEVCGDPATGYHYDVGTCNGCKTFFRRAILNGHLYTCRSGGGCTSLLRKDSRIKCRACRFDRCVTKGMNPLAILTAPTTGELNPVMRYLVERRREVGMTALLPLEIKQEEEEEGEKMIVNGIVRPYVSPLRPSPRFVEDSVEKMIDMLLHLEIAHEKLRKSQYSPQPMEEMCLRDVLSGPSKLGVDYGEMPARTTKLRKFHDDYTIEEHVRLRIPFPARPPFPLGRDKKHHHKMWPFANMIYAIEYLKTFDFFRRLSDDDQFVLSRHVCLLTSQITAAFFSYSAKSEMTVDPDGNMPFGGQLPNSKHEYDNHKRVISMLIATQIHRNEYVLLKALISCNPALDDLSREGRAILTRERDRFALSLLSYTLAARGLSKGPEAYSALLAIVDTLSHVVKNHKDMFVLIRVLGLHKTPEKHSQLIKEVFEFC